MNDTELLQKFAHEGSENAFRTLVERHLPLVFGTARRLTNDDTLAEDVTQTVFILLARKAASLGTKVVVVGWLYRSTRFVAARALTSELRRRRREEEAYQMHAPTNELRPRIATNLDELLGQLGEQDRNALVVRYLEDRPWGEVAGSLGLSEAAAKKRASRALEKLRDLFRRRGVEITVDALAIGLAAESARAAGSAALVSRISGTALAKLGAGAGLGAGSALVTEVLAAWRWAKIKAIIGAAAAIIVLLTIPMAVKPFFSWGNKQSPQRSTSANRSAAKHLDQSAMRSATATNETGGFKVQVLDAVTDKPITTARGSDSTHWWLGQEKFTKIQADVDGVITLTPAADFLKDGQRRNYDVWVQAPGYAMRDISFFCSTGSVHYIISSNYTLRLERGLTLSGRVQNDSGEPMAHVQIKARGNNFPVYTTSTDEKGQTISAPAKHAADFANFWTDDETPIFTGPDGRFSIPHVSSDLDALLLELKAEDGSRKGFSTYAGKGLTVEATEEIKYSALKNGTAVFVIPSGLTVSGLVTSPTGEPMPAAKITEASQFGDVKILSESLTDTNGYFVLSNREPREFLFTAMAPGYAALSKVVTVQKGMKPVEFKLTLALPLRGQVVDSRDNPQAGVSIGLVSYLTPGFGLPWSGKTEADGKFVWEEAPTNEFVFYLKGEAGVKVVRLHATTNEQKILLSQPSAAGAKISATVRDAQTLASIPKFEVSLCYDSGGEKNQAAAKKIEGHDGAFDLFVPNDPAQYRQGWMLIVRAEGYEPFSSQFYQFLEGDQELEFALQPGGQISGRAIAPDGTPAVGAQVAAFSPFNQLLAQKPGQLYKGKIKIVKSDQQGRFSLLTEPDTTSLVIFHDSGWAIEPLIPHQTNAIVSLQPWGTIEGTLHDQIAFQKHYAINLNYLIFDNGQPVCVLYQAVADSSGHFKFEKVPAGQFQVSISGGQWLNENRSIVSALQTSVQVSAGETAQIELGGTGSPVSVQLHYKQDADWKICTVILKKDVLIPVHPGRDKFVSNEAEVAARFAYARDPAVLAAMSAVHDFVAEVNDEGLATFSQVPAGEYILEAKLFSGHPTRGIESVAIQAKVQARVTIPETSANDSVISLGDYQLEEP